jgi:hypothetical protein
METRLGGVKGTNSALRAAKFELFWREKPRKGQRYSLFLSFNFFPTIFFHLFYLFLFFFLIFSPAAQFWSAIDLASGS